MTTLNSHTHTIDKLMSGATHNAEFFITGDNAKTYEYHNCLLYTSDAADDSLRVDLGGRRIIKK